MSLAAPRHTSDIIYQFTQDTKMPYCSSSPATADYQWNVATISVQTAKVQVNKSKKVK